ncbi:MAG: hypothetical protein M3143_01820, partial [Actinomycetota bacterium]|nr:hypothetical protein [Actinomycetota bacterium]
RRTLHLEFDYLGPMKAYERAYSASRREGNVLAAARRPERWGGSTVRCTASGPFIAAGSAAL